MAEYKKKKVAKKLPRQSVSKERKPEPIEMRESRRPKRITNDRGADKQDFKILKGQKKDVRLSVIITVVLAIVLVCVYLIILAFHPIGVVEYFSSLYKTIGSGSGYDIELRGEDIIDCSRDNGYYYLLTQTDVECINNNGKIISHITHGFARPVLTTAETRYLVYGQGENSVKVYNYDKELVNKQFDQEILCADVSDVGTYAVATFADGYDSAVRVYDKNENSLFEWFSANGIVNSVTLTEDGKKLIVSVFSAEQGMINSKLYILGFNSAEPEQTYTYNDDIFYGVYNISPNMISVVSEKSIRFINLKESKVTTSDTDYSYKIAEQYNDKLILVSSLSANVEKNNVTVYDKDGSVEAQFSVDFPVEDIACDHNYFYLLGDSVIHLIDKQGNAALSIEVPFDTKAVIPISEKLLASASNSMVLKHEFNVKE